MGVGGGDFGKEMDSLCDMCSFGVAPAIMIYQFGLQELGLLGQVIAALFAVGGCLRLARFNCNTGVVHGYFQGMPIPAGACFLAAYVLSGYSFGTYAVAAMTLVIAVIMYSEVRFPDFKGKGNPMYRLPVIIALVIGAAMLFNRPGAWPFIGMFTRSESRRFISDTLPAPSMIIGQKDWLSLSKAAFTALRSSSRPSLRK